MSVSKADREGPISIGGRSLADQLAQRTHSLVAETVRVVRTDVPFYRSLPEEAIRNDVTAIVRRNLELFIAMLRTAREPTPSEVADLRVSAGHRAEELVPLAEILHAYHLGVQQWWASIAGLAGGGDGPALARAGQLLHTYLLAATSAVVAGYGSDHAPPSEDDGARRALLMALSSGADPAGAADRVGLTLARLYWVVALHVDPHPDEAAAGVDTAVAERRKVRRLQRELDNVGRDKALCAVTSSGGTVLIPIVDSEPTEGNWSDSPQYVALRRNLLDLERVIGAAVVTAVSAAAPTRIPGALVEAREVLEVARRHGHRTGLFRLQDVPVEYQLSRPSAAHAVLADLLSPLGSHESVLRTLEAYVDAGYDRAAAATALHVHPNTVAYRLRKLATLTGLDVSSPRDLVRVTAALAARRCAGSETLQA
ncbi:PucR C-terminal helix-turn-helix domain-containing protein [Rhodococcus tukisamuensis]|uniref:PucR C-terminal helix-turn-helix domain-containing protein n=1 Tax=Rhodococcus tukisamuensis TaxID=168276 RepID=A0A1G7CA15_9NOCA|nr:PucR C-terminal helix-turn-helix domain-containing protein [Rhodococcus tukisamuensis]